MITGAHVVIYSKDAERDRRFFRDVLDLPHVDAGHGWLIFALPPSEVAMHPADENDSHELFLTCADLKSVVTKLKRKKIGCTPVTETSWGSVTRITLPGGGKLGLYQPKHALAHEATKG